MRRQNSLDRVWWLIAAVSALSAPSSAISQAVKSVWGTRLRPVIRTPWVASPVLAHRTWRCRAEILTSIPGISDITAAGLIIHMPELGTLTGARSRMIEPGKSGHRNGGVARNAARHLSAASAGIHLTWILPTRDPMREGCRAAEQDRVPRIWWRRAATAIGVAVLCRETRQLARRQAGVESGDQVVHVERLVVLRFEPQRPLGARHGSYGSLSRSARGALG